MKFSSWNVLYLPLVRAAFPVVPWVFVYRHPVEVMVANLAKNHAVAGHVKNLANGNVEVLAEGPPDEVEAFLSAIEREMDAYIEDRAVELKSTRGLEGFRIAH